MGRQNCTLWQISVCGSACAICKCVQCAWASPTVPKGRGGLAKTNFFLQYLSINATILSIRFFNFLSVCQCTVVFFTLAPNICVCTTFLYRYHSVVTIFTLYTYSYLFKLLIICSLYFPNKSIPWHLSIC